MPFSGVIKIAFSEQPPSRNVSFLSFALKAEESCSSIKICRSQGYVAVTD